MVQDLELVGTWYSGQHKRVVHGIDGVLLLVVIGEGKLVVPVDFAVRRPNPKGPGARCRSKLGWAQVMLDESLAALRRRGLELPAPLVVADSWFSDSKLMAHVAHTHQGTLLGARQDHLYLLPWQMAARSRGLIWCTGRPIGRGGRASMRRAVAMPGCGRRARPMARSPAPRRQAQRGSLLPVLFGLTDIPATRLLRAWSRRHLIEQVFRTLKHLLGHRRLPSPQ